MNSLPPIEALGQKVKTKILNQEKLPTSVFYHILPLFPMS